MAWLNGRAGGVRANGNTASTSGLDGLHVDLLKRTIPANAILHDFRVGPGHEGLGEHNPDMVSFHFDGEGHFNIANEIVGRTVVVKAA